jgi:putative transposase
MTRPLRSTTITAASSLLRSSQTVLPSAETAAMLFWALLASGQINMRKVDGWKTLAAKRIAQPIDLAA